MNDSNPYEMATTLDSDDDHPIGELIESDVEMLRRIFPGHRDPRVYEYSWGSAMLAFLYWQLCKACHQTSSLASLGGCVYLL
jgi:hypothetical protein